MYLFTFRTALCRLAMLCLFITGLCTMANAQTTLFKETFNNISGITDGGAGTYVFPAGWKLVNVDNRTPSANVAYVNDAWERREDFITNVADSCAFSTSWYTPAGAADDWMWTPAITLTGTNLTLKWRAFAPDATFRDGYEVRIMTIAPNGSTGNLGNMVSASTLLFSIAEEQNAWASHEVSLDAYAGQTVYIGFRNNSTDKFMLLADDITVENHSNHDAVLTAINNNYEYTQTPLNQINGLPLGGTIRNEGIYDITNVKLNVKITNSKNKVVYTAASGAGTISSGASYSFGVPAWQPTAPDIYTIKYYPTLDQPDDMHSNDTMVTQFTITDSVYARDDGNGIGPLGVGAAVPAYLGQSFTINANSILSSVTLKFMKGYPGQRYAAAVWSTDASGKPVSVIATTDTLLYTLTDSLKPTIPIHNRGVLLTPGRYVVAAIEFDSLLTLQYTNGIYTPNTLWGYVNGVWNVLENFGPNYKHPFYLRLNLTTCIGTSRLYVDAARKNLTGDGSSWKTAVGTLDKALLIAKMCGNINEIWVKSGTYKPAAFPLGSTGGATTRDFAFGLQNGVAIYGGFAGTETALAERNITANPTILSGNIRNLSLTSDNCYHVIVSAGNDTTAILDGFTISDGNASSTTASISVNGLNVSANKGGGLYAAYSSPTIRNCAFSNNSAYYGGGIAAVISSSTLHHNSFLLNKATTTGGAVFFSQNSNVYLHDNYFERNTAQYGGAGRFEGSVLLNAVSNVFYSNIATTQGGGALSLADYYQPDTLVNNIFAYNKDSGGAAYGGGALAIENGYSYIVNNTFFADSAVNRGGAIRFTGTVGSLGLYNNIFNKCSGAAVNDIDVANTAAVYAQSNNLFSTANPLFNNINDLDGPDNTWATADDGLGLRTGSPALNKGNNTKVPALITTDITGSVRLKSTNVDIGAYEGVAATLTGIINHPAGAVCKNVASPLTFTAQNGIAPFIFTYSINGGSNLTVASAGKNMFATVPLPAAAGTATYQLKQVVDSTGNTAVVNNQQATINVVPVAAVTITPDGGTDSTCFGVKKKITASASGGTSPYLYSTDAVTYRALDNFTVEPGTYTIWAKDASKCISSGSITITQPAAKLNLTLVRKNVTCNGGTNGSVTPTAAGGFGGYLYSLNGGPYTNVSIFANLPANNYTVSVKDAAGCLASKSTTVTQPATPCLTGTTPAATEAAALQVQTSMLVNAYPNPSQAQFNLRLTGGDGKNKVEIRVMDMLGKTIYIARGSIYDSYSFGAQWPAGMYMAEVINGKNVQRVKLAKGSITGSK